MGDELVTGRQSNFGGGRTANNVYITETLDAATWGAELEYATHGGREHDFQYGSLFWSPATGVHEVRGAILYRFLHDSAAGLGHLGFPTTDELDNPSRATSHFQYGSIVYDPSTNSTSITHP